MISTLGIRRYSRQREKRARVRGTYVRKCMRGARERICNVLLHPKIWSIHRAARVSASPASSQIVRWCSIIRSPPVYLRISHESSNRYLQHLPSPLLPDSIFLSEPRPDISTPPSVSWIRVTEWKGMFFFLTVWEAVDLPVNEAYR